MDDGQDTFFRVQVADLFLLSGAFVVSLAGIYFAFRDLPSHGTTLEIRALRPRTTALSTALLILLCIVPTVLISSHIRDHPSLSDVRAALKYLGAVAGTVDAGVTFLALSFQIRLVDLVYGPPANASFGADAAAKTSERLIKFLGLAVVLAFVNMLVIVFGFPDDQPITKIPATYIVMTVISFLVHLMYLITATVALIRTKNRTSHGPLLAVAILAPLRLISDVITPFIVFGVSKLFGPPTFIKFISAWGMLGVILKQFNVAIIVLVLVKVLANHLANPASTEEPEDETRRPLLDSANEQPADTFSAAS